MTHVPFPHGFATQQVHAGSGPDPATGARITPVHLTAGFVFDDFEQARARFAGEDDGYVYTRTGNPTTAALETRLATLEGGTDALVVGTGQAAITVALLGILGAGDHVVAAGDLYEGSRGLLLDNFGRLGISVDFVPDTGDPAAWEARVRPNTRAFFAESIANPKAVVLDVPTVAAVAHRHGIPLVVDNTFATPYLLRPLEHGADVVVHSASKFLAGHGAALGGAVVTGPTTREAFDWSGFGHLTAPAGVLGGISWVERFGPRRAYVEHTRAVVASRLGPTISPFNAFLVQQGLETLSLRVARQSATALELARWLQARPEVASVDHAGLASHASHDVAARLLPRGSGAVFSFTLEGGRPAAQRFVDAVRLFTRMTHVGDVRSLVIHPASTTHAHRSEGERLAAGIWPGLVRLSIGLEEPEDLLADLLPALAAAVPAPTPAGV
ncbi:O-acetylhomoserine (thiol)-lyase [Kineococcus radiotolerans]|uniref:O-acetylhomoserine (Thiol)-lyase n=1 Tax=Kineococcus radiotolerans TaxID=131568 RepID=A0A7W4TJB6_KINRA|nr:aminotransferase class I/II-fold pyridoxal phosphate-dependent enzyme [Kineococcus radiotolerans]MBB2899969.1 O-acetylhomoserine (thiol)-lyase [Kineococcus radiotolerans]